MAVPTFNDELLSIVDTANMIELANPPKPRGPYKKKSES